jgi:serine/threonine protein phosphatase 1
MSQSHPSVPEGQRLYAIGDIHGCLDLLKKLLAKIEEDRKTTSHPSRLIFLGDYVDRGLHSREVIEFLIHLSASEKIPPLFMLGNHEQIMRNIIETGDEELLEDWLRFGGRETLLSYGLKPQQISGDAEEVVATLNHNMPAAHKAFLKDLNVAATIGDYFFCHAGVRPGVKIEEQAEEDLLWIRDEFLDYAKPFGKIVVHGHSICYEAELRPNRVGIDTGAYATGRLTALGLEGHKQWLITTE